MARFLGSSSSKGGGTPSITIVPTTPYTRATGITTDANNNVTSITLGDASYTSILYNAVGLITSYTENISGTSKRYILTYDANSTVTAITEVL
jgi:hypothetical protein